MTKIANEFEHAINGVAGRMGNIIIWPPEKIREGADSTAALANQQWSSRGRPVKGYGKGGEIRVNMRYDDNCSNGHASFSITADVTVPAPKKQGKYYGRADVAGGCLHEDIARVFPELAHFIPWHLCSSDGPMHYLANTVYQAGDRDHYGKKAGEPRQWDTAVQFGANPIKHRTKYDAFARFLQEASGNPGMAGPFDFEVIAMHHADKSGHRFAPKYTYGGFASEWYQCPFDTEGEALDFLAALQTCEPKFIRIATAWGEGKARDFDAARRSAAWPEATDEELSLEPDQLREILNKRLPGLIYQFREIITGAGFLWEPPV